MTNQDIRIRLVERLRARTELFPAGPEAKWNDPDKLCTEAADRIEELENALFEIRRLVEHSVFDKSVRVRQIVDTALPL